MKLFTITRCMWAVSLTILFSAIGYGWCCPASPRAIENRKSEDCHKKGGVIVDHACVKVTITPVE